MCVPHLGYTQNSDSHSLAATLQEEPILHLGEFHGCGAFFVVVSYVVDPCADGIAPHQAGIAGL